MITQDARVLINLRDSISLIFLMIILAILTGLTLWFYHQDHYAIGRIVSINDIPGRQQTLAMVEVPGLTSQALRFNHRVENEEAISIGCWIIAKGEPRIIRVSIRILDVKNVQIFPLRVNLPTINKDGLGKEFLNVLDGHRLLTLIAGSVILVVGLILARVLGAGFMGTLASVLVWHLAAIAYLEGMVTVPGKAWPVLLAMGFLLGFIVSVRDTSIPGFLAQRLVIIGALLILPEAMSTVLNWPVEIVRIVTVLGTIISPAIGIWLLASFFLAVGLSAEGPAVNLILVAAGAATHILTRGRWIPNFHKPMFLDRQVSDCAEGYGR
jgi:hypothetical protein